MLTSDKISLSVSFSNFDESVRVYKNIKTYIETFMSQYIDDILETVEPRFDRYERVYYFEFEFPRNLPNKYLANIIKLMKGYSLDKTL